MMLAADPATGDIRRFLTGPRGCEVTGITATPDLRTLFVNIQHPGEPASERLEPERTRARQHLAGRSRRRPPARGHGGDPQG